MESFVKRRSMRRLLALCVASAGWAAVAQAQSRPGNVAHGHALAEEFCTQCHVIVRNGPGGWTDAPSFPKIADGPNATAPRLQAILLQPHMHMLHLPRSASDAADLSAYIMSLRQH